MRFRELYEIWRRDNSLKLALGECYEMLDRAMSMFRESVKLLRSPETTQMAFDIYAEDRQLNAYQVQVRSRVFRYLAVAGTVDLIPGLVLTSIVIDIERIGDYTKNITELGMTYPHKLDCARFEKEVRGLEQIVERLFSEVRRILETSDQQAARALINECERIRKDADHLISQLVQFDDESLGRGQTAVIALYARYLKRIGAHLLNILSSVVNPFERIGYRVTEQGE